MLRQKHRKCSVGALHTLCCSKYIITLTLHRGMYHSSLQSIDDELHSLSLSTKPSYLERPLDHHMQLARSIILIEFQIAFDRQGCGFRTPVAPGFLAVPSHCEPIRFVHAELRKLYIIGSFLGLMHSLSCRLTMAG